MHKSIRPAALYLGDNGRCLCGDHLGATAQATFRDISGQRLHCVTKSDADALMLSPGIELRCETCGRSA